MSDEQLRALERRWRETGAVADEALYLFVQDKCRLCLYLSHSSPCGDSVA